VNVRNSTNGPTGSGRLIVPSFDEVVAAWQQADVTAIHPLRNVSDEAYWASGRAQALEAAIWIPSEGTVLDFGCGDGRLAIPLAKLGYDVLAVDASQEMLDRVRERCTNMTFIQWDGYEPLDRVGPVDTVVARAVFIHHDYESVTTLVTNLAGLLKPGGYLICDWPISEAPRERRDWIDVTTWDYAHRHTVATSAGLELIANTTPSVWRKL
jgi:2-polyprenyl-3-methyl-5-hydroxy-6-metoxy-1,4-benzoquinol methylase